MSNLNREQCPLEKGFNINKEFCKVTGFFLTTAHVKSVFRSCFLCWYLYSQLNIPFKVTKSSHPILLLYRAIATIYWALETAFLGIEREHFCSTGMALWYFVPAAIDGGTKSGSCSLCWQTRPALSLVLGLPRWDWAYPCSGHICMSPRWIL